VVVDGEYAFGNGLMIPAGPLRETVPQGLARADAVIVMGDGSPDLHDFRGPVLRAKLAAEGEEFRGRHVFAFAGIGRPEKFVASLEKTGAIVTGTQFFADHHPYRDGEIAALKARAGDAQIVTTEKDFVRLSPPDRAGIAVLPVRAIFDDMALLDQLLGRLA
jgi:tetraacyldisaccharide 4'-kinase